MALAASAGLPYDDDYLLPDTSGTSARSQGLFWTVTLNPALDHVYRLPAGEGDAVLAEEAWHLPAGKGLNVARALSALGVPCVAVVLVSPDLAPTFRDEMIAHGVTPRLLPLLPRTRHHVTLLGAAPGTLHHVREVGAAAPADTPDRLKDALADCQPGDHVALSGSLAPGLPADLYARFARTLGARGANVWLDTSGEPLARALGAHLYGLKVNGQEASHALQRPVSSPDQAAAAARELAATGIRVVCITLGRQGLVLAHDGRTVYAPCPTVEQGSPVGSGDAALAALMTGTALQYDARHLAAAAAAAGAANARSLLPGSLSPETYAELLARGLSEVRDMDP